MRNYRALMVILLVSLAPISVLAAPCAPPTLNRPCAYIPSTGFDYVAVIDTATDTVVTTIPTGVHPNGVAILPDGTRVYMPHDTEGTVWVINTTTNTVINPPIPIAPITGGIAIHPDGTRVYVRGGDTIFVINTATNTVVNTNSPGMLMGGMAIHPAGTFLYVGAASNSVYVINTNTNAVVQSISVGNGPYGVAVHPAGTCVYVANHNDNSASVIETATNTVVATIPVGQGPTGVAVHPDGTLVYIVQYDGNNMSVIKTGTNNVIRTVPVGGAPLGVAVYPQGNALYVTNLADDDVSHFDLSTYSLIKNIVTGLYHETTSLFIGPIASMKPLSTECKVASISVSIDIEPGELPNAINPSSKGTIPVAILTTATFDATTVNTSTVRFGKTGTEAALVRSAVEDVDGDGDIDLLLHFNTQDTGIKCGDTSAAITGKTSSGQAIQGSDSIQTVGCK